MPATWEDQIDEGFPPVEHRLHSSRIIGETEFLTTKGNNKIKERPIKNRTGEDQIFAKANPKFCS